MVKPAPALLLLFCIALGAAGLALRMGAEPELAPLTPALASGAQPAEKAPTQAAESTVLRRSLSLPLPPPPEYGEPGPEGIPPSAVVLRLVRWPDGAKVAGVRVQVVDTGRSTIIRTVTPASGRLRLSDGLKEDLAAVFVRAEGFEPLRVEATQDSSKLEYLAMLRPTKGWYGQVVDWDGAPLPKVAVQGFWVEDPRPLRGGDKIQPLGKSVLKRLSKGSLADERVTTNRRARTLRATNTRLGKSLSDHRSLRMAVAQLHAERSQADLEALAQRFFESEDVRRSFSESADMLPSFLAAHGELKASALTDDEGWFYVEPLPGFVLGNMSLMAVDSPGSSDVLRVPLPSAGPELPRIVVHRPRILTIRVVDPLDAPIEGARVLHALAGGWSPMGPLAVTDERGQASFSAPAADLLIAVEKQGFGQLEPSVWRPASADQLWSDLKEITPPGASAKNLFKLAYPGWRDPLPRARGFEAVERWASDATLVVEPLGMLLFKLVDAEGNFPLPNVRVTARYGGLDAGSELAKTALDGTAEITLVDREWQPMVVTFSAPGYQSYTISIPPGDLKSFGVPWEIGLGEDRGVGSSVGAASKPNGLVRGQRGPLGAEILMYERPPSARKNRLLYAGAADDSGGFRYSLPTESSQPPTGLYAYAVHRHRHTGLPYMGLSTGLLEPVTRTVENPLRLQLVESLPLNLTLDYLEAARPYRVDWELRPFSGAKAILSGSIAVPANHTGRFQLDVPIPKGWQFSAKVFGASVGNGPELAFTRGPSQKPFASTQPTWESWELVKATVHQKVQRSGQKMYLRVERQVGLSGIVTDLPYYPDPDRVQVAAIGSAGTWFSPVSGNGWFDLPRLPAGTYQLVLYERPSSREGPGELHQQGDVRGQMTVELEFHRHDVELPWVQPEDQDPDGR